MVRILLILLLYPNTKTLGRTRYYHRLPRSLLALDKRLGASKWHLGLASSLGFAVDVYNRMLSTESVEVGGCRHGIRCRGQYLRIIQVD